ncbi:MAG: PKD domain-containing protein [Candidatus Omnitrophota bacterium]
MKKIASVFLLAVFLSGCATYKFQHGQPPYDKGYIASRDSYVILEYTVGSDNSVPAELDLAKQRFWRRHKMVEHYYKKMERIENRFKMAVYDPATMFIKLICGVLRLPFIAISDYKYDHNPVYREKIRKIEEEKDLREEARVAKFKERLDLYIQSVLTTEKPFLGVAKPKAPRPVKPTPKKKAESIKKELASIEAAAKQAAPKVEQPVLSGTTVAGETQAVSAELDKVQRQQKAAKQKPQPAKKQPQVISGEPIAVIIAKPQRGFSPLTVHLYSSRSRSPAGKIVSCSWDFGDGDISNKTNPTNTYYSGSSQAQAFTVTLTVTDVQGNTATATSVIEVLNK